MSRCQWKGISEQGSHLICTNYRLIHPWKTQTNVYGRILPKREPFCAYHTKFCIDVHQYHYIHAQQNRRLHYRPVKIRRKNKFALCNQCFVEKMHQSPVILHHVRIPGLSRLDNEMKDVFGSRRVQKHPKAK